jgi:hypothetical protein
MKLEKNLIKHIMMIMEQLHEIKMEQHKSNRMLLERRKSSMQMSVVGEGGGVNDIVTPKSLTEKGVPVGWLREVVGENVVCFLDVTVYLYM